MIIDDCIMKKGYKHYFFYLRHTLTYQVLELKKIQVGVHNRK